MTKSWIAAATAVCLCAGTQQVSAHQLNVFASTDCNVVLVEAKYSTGRIPKIGEVRVRDGADELLINRALQDDGTLAIPMDEIDASSGLKIEVEAGHHEDYWILTPEDIAKKCQS